MGRRYQKSPQCTYRGCRGMCRTCDEWREANGIGEYSKRNRNEGTIYQRGPHSATPRGQSVRGSEDGSGTIGKDEHITQYGEGWHRSWDNPGTEGDHTTDHRTGEITQND